MRKMIVELHPNKMLRKSTKHLFDEIAGRFEDREGGYTRVIRAGKQRGDGTQMAILELTE